MSEVSGQKTVLEVFELRLLEKGLHAALETLNDRTPHRYTGLYVVDRRSLLNVALYDSFHPDVTRGNAGLRQVNMHYLSQGREVWEQDTDKCQPTTEAGDANGKEAGGIDPEVVFSFCGVLLRDRDGGIMGTLCHFDPNRCQERKSDLPILQSAAEILKRRLTLRVAGDIRQQQLPGAGASPPA